MTTRCEPSVEPGEECALEDPTAAFAATAASAAAPDPERLRSAALAETTSRAVSATDAARDAPRRTRVVPFAFAV